MATIFLIFFLTAAISFMGSVQLGPVNAMVVQATIQKSLKAGLLVALGGAVPELIYSALALGGSRFLASNAVLLNALKWGIVPIFLLIGIVTIYNQTKKKESEISSQFVDKQPFAIGFSLGLLNPQLLPFWLSVLIYLKTFFEIDTLATQAAFVAGTAAGALGILALFAWATHKYKEKLLKIAHRIPMGYVVGVIFILMAILQFIKQVSW